MKKQYFKLNKFEITIRVIITSKLVSQLSKKNKKKINKYLVRKNKKKWKTKLY